MDSIQRKPFIKNIGKASPKNVSKKHKFHSQEMPLTEKIFCRTFQKGLFLSLPFLPYRDPEILQSIDSVAIHLQRFNLKKVLLIADPALVQGTVFKEIIKTLHHGQIDFVLFDEVHPNPTTASVHQAAALYRKNNCQATIAYGGGSAIDLAKACGAAIAKPDKTLSSMAGSLKVLKKTPHLIAIPTTCGTGSEATLAAVLVDETTHHKFAISDFPLIPDAAVLDARCIHELPPFLVATTGMDALCHAVEAYIGQSVTKETGNWALEAVRLIFSSLDACVKHESEQAERNMLMASHLAGKAFTRSYVGYIHALSHALSGQYNLPHGKTNAILMPIILREYGNAIYPALSQLAKAAELQEYPMESQKDLALKFIDAIEKMNERYGIPCGIAEIDLKGIKVLAHHAAKEANPLYPVPVLFSESRLREIYLKSIL